MSEMKRMIVCARCNRAFSSWIAGGKSGVRVRVMFQRDKEVQSVWSADLHVCPGCGFKVICNFADKPLGAHYLNGFNEVLSSWEEANRKGEAYTIYEKCQSTKEGRRDDP